MQVGCCLELELRPTLHISQRASPVPGLGVIWGAPTLNLTQPQLALVLERASIHISTSVSS
jgi:hypothetical protein